MVKKRNTNVSQHTFVSALNFYFDGTPVPFLKITVVLFLLPPPCYLCTRLVGDSICKLYI